MVPSIEDLEAIERILDHLGRGGGESLDPLDPAHRSWAPPQGASFV